MRKLFYLLLVLILIFASACFFSYREAVNFSGSYISNNPSELPAAKVGVLLGTSRYIPGGRPNLYFKYRMDAAVRLYKAGNIEFILVSGDNRRRDYNEPVQMQKALLERGIPAEKIILDYAGFRTLDSMVRAKEVFGQDSFIVISQKFHNERAVYIARMHHIDAYGFNARDVTAKAGLRTNVREVLARVKMMLDIHILKTEPKFLGEKIVIG